MTPRSASRPPARSLRALAGTVGDSLFGARRGAAVGTPLEAVSAAARGLTEDDLTLRLLAERARRTLSRTTGTQLFSHSVYATSRLDELLVQAAWVHEQFAIEQQLDADADAHAAVHRELRVVQEVLWWFSTDAQLADAVTFALGAAVLAHRLPGNVVEALTAPLLVGVVKHAVTDPAADGTAH